ncbi:ATP-binding cassette domain-containing protein, partial [Acinetobacter baumannii]|uniref:ATP-binding cassette domain-containing protein n=1 Tax=Acinetobacter baumannii TaxID=470 RepID=UPI002A0A8D1D
MPAIEYVIDGDREFRQLEAELQAANDSNDGHAIATLHGKLDAIDAWTIRSRAARLLHGLGFANEQLQSPVRDFSGGWRMRLNLAQALVCRSDLLLLDEPTNHLDIETIDWLEGFLKEFDGSIVFISHDRSFIRNMATRIVDLDRGKLVSWPGNYDLYLQ